MYRGLRWVATFVVPMAAAAPISAQVALGPTTPRFAKIASIAQEGYGDSARTLIARVLAATPKNDLAYVEALYTAGSVAPTGDSTRVIFQRIVVEYSTSPWADKSLLRLIQLDYGRGKLDMVLVESGRLFSEFPDSPVIPDAARWGARAAFSQNKPQIGCDWLTRGIAKVGDDLELRNQLLFLKQSCNLGPGVEYAQHNPDSLRQGPPPRAPDTTPRAPKPAAPPTGAGKPPAKEVASPWRVQVAAIRDKVVIQQVIRRIESGGFKAYAVPGPGGLTRVQAGPFATRAAAVAALAKVKAAAGGSPIVVAAP